MNLNRKEYLNKIRGCFIGKNIGGTLGGPYEGKREILNVKGFSTTKGEPLPNDDLDLQLVWLHAVECEGPRNIDAKTLGEYWMSFITPYWSEYGISKTFMLRGVSPSVAGDIDANIWKHSNGSWIRTEIWACLNPGAIDTAVKYAIEDSLVDHGLGEGTWAARFVAALESAAFFINDIKKLIEIGLAKIEKNSRVYKTIKYVLKRFNDKADYILVRNEIIKMNMDIGDGWFQAPNNIAFVIIGLLWGKGDFKKSMIYSCNCGDDTDCTCATVGSILGIMYGEDKIPSDWKEFIGNNIVTCSINKGVSFIFPKTLDDLVNRVSNQVDYCLLSNKTGITLSEQKTEIDPKMIKAFSNKFGEKDERDEMRSLLASLRPNSFKMKTGAVTTIVTYENGIYTKVGENKKLTIMAVNNYKAKGNACRQVMFELILPKGFECEQKFKEAMAPHWTPMTIDGNTEKLVFDLKINEANGNDATVILKVKINDNGTEYFVPIKFLYK